VEVDFIDRLMNPLEESNAHAPWAYPTALPPKVRCRIRLKPDSDEFANRKRLARPLRQVDPTEN
jgi:hypothetical protein